MKARHPRLAAPRSIFVLKPSSFGDIIHALPAVARLRQHWPETRVSWLVNPEWSPLLEGNPLVDEAVIFPRQRLRGLRGAFRLPAWLREHIAGRKPGLTLDYQGLLRTALIGRCAGGCHFAGLSDAREGAGWFYDEVVAVPPSQATHAVERYLALTDAVTGATRADQSGEKLCFPLPAGEPLPATVVPDQPFVLLHPFSRGEAKSLTIPQVRLLCEGLVPVPVVIVGQWPGPALDLPANSLNLLNQTTLSQLLTLTRAAGFVVSVDSGPAHLAAALNKPLVAIHTWSDPRRVGPYRPAAWVLKNGRLLRVAELAACEESFFEQPPGEILSATQARAICRLATSSSDFYA